MALEPLSKSKHANLKLGAVDLTYFSDLPLIPIYAREISNLACEYPLCFTVKNNSVELCLLAAIDPKSGSVLIKEDGKWVGRYVPFYLRHHPFFATSAADQMSSIFIEEDSPRLGETDGVALFENSEPTKVLARIITDMNIIFESARQTQEILKALQDFQLITPWDARFKLESGEEIVIGDIFRVDENILNKLSSNRWNELRGLNALPVIYGQLFSTNNLTKLVMYQNMKQKLSSQRDLGLTVDANGQALNFDAENEDEILNFDNL